MAVAIFPIGPLKSCCRCSSVCRIIHLLLPKTPTITLTVNILFQEDKLHTKEKVFTWSSNEPAPSG